MKNRIPQLVNILSKLDEVAFAYLHGSSLTSVSPRDLDIGVFIYPAIYHKLADTGEVNIGFAIPLEMKLDKMIDIKTDVQILNAAPLSFRHRIVKEGVLLIDNDTQLRCDFEYLSRYQYFDFQPRRAEYLKEVLT